MKKMRKTLSLILSLVLAFSLAAVPAFAADATEAETSTSDTAYGQLHNGLLSEILSRIDIANDDNFIHGIVNVNINDLVDHIVSNNNYMHGIITITGNTVNINFGQVIGDIAAGGANSEAAQQALAEILKAFGMTQTGINAILTGFAGSILTNDQIAQLLSQLISSANMNLKNIVTIICALYNSRTITLQQAMALLEKYIFQMGNNSGSGNNSDSGNNSGSGTGTEPTQSAGLLDTTNHNAYASGRTATTFVPNGTLTRAAFVTMLGRMAGVKDTDYTTSVFRDVPDGEWYTSFVAWATENGIVDGYGDGIFLPQNNITRQEMAKIMAKYLNWKGLDTTPSSEISSYPINDLNAIGGWALEPVCFCYEQGLLNGRGSNFAPQANATRAEACVVLCRLQKYVDEQSAQPAAAEPAALAG